MIGLGTLLALGIIGAIGSAGASIGSALINRSSQEETNKANIDMQTATNQQNQYNMEHAHQMEVADLQKAGLNPVLSAGGSGAPIQSLQSPKATAPELDLSGVSSALSGLTSTMMMSTLLSEKNSLISQQNDILQQRANSYSALADSNSVLNKHKLSSLTKSGSLHAHTAKTITKYDNFSWNELIKELDSVGKKKYR